jgi:uncharacterized protein YndB with AHSA1/START domain
MDAFETEVVINGPQEKVFDVLTTAGHWPQWAIPARDMQSSASARAWITRAVAGVTERPFQLGDHITEFIRTPSGPQEVLWHVTEHDRPRRAKLQAEDGTTVTYILTGQGDDTSFRRVVELGSVLGAQQIPSDTAKSESANVKALVEKILWREQNG